MSFPSLQPRSNKILSDQRTMVQLRAPRGAPLQRDQIGRLEYLHDIILIMIRVRLMVSSCILLILIWSLLAPVLAGGTGVGLEDVGTPVVPTLHPSSQSSGEPESKGNVSVNNSTSTMITEEAPTLGDLIRTGDLDAIDAYQNNRMNNTFDRPERDLSAEQGSNSASEHEQTTRVYVIRYPCP